MTFENSQQIDLLPMELPTLMSSRAASPARTSASRDAASDFPVSVPVSLRRSPVWLANFDHSSFCRRTSQSCLVEGLETFSERWPRSGMMRNGIAYQRPSLAQIGRASCRERVCQYV